MGKAKSKGALLHDALVKVDLRDHEDWLGSPTEQPMFEQAAQEYEKAVAADLPADVNAFLAEVEARESEATPGPWEASTWYCSESIGGWSATGPHHLADEDESDEPGSIAHDKAIHDAEFIARARTDIPALLGIIRKMAASIAAFREQQAEHADELHRATLRESNAKHELSKALGREDDLRSRLVTIESAARDTLNLLGPEYFDDGKPLAELGHLVNIKGDANG